jgi:hypothetical protein
MFGELDVQATVQPVYCGKVWARLSGLAVMKLTTPVRSAMLPTELQFSVQNLV